MAAKIVNLDDFKSARIERASTVSYTGPWLIEEIDGEWSVLAERVTRVEAERLCRYLAARLGWEVRT